FFVSAEPAEREPPRPESTKEAVARETPAARATSARVTVPRDSRGIAAPPPGHGAAGPLVRARHRAVSPSRSVVRSSAPVLISPGKSTGQPTAPPVSQARAGPAVFSAMSTPMMPTAHEKALVAFFTAQS